MPEIKHQNLNDYLSSENRKEFIDKCIAKGMKRDTARRRYYKLRSFTNSMVPKNAELQIVPQTKDIRMVPKPLIITETPQPRMVPKTEVNGARFSIDSDAGLIVIPDTMKLIQLTDMKRYKKKINESLLEKNGFTPSDIAWVKYMGIA